MRIGSENTPHRTMSPSGTTPNTPQTRAATGSTGSANTPGWQNPVALAGATWLRMPNFSSQAYVGDTKAELDLGHGEKFELTRFNTKVNEVKFSQQPGVAQDVSFNKSPLDPREPLAPNEQAGVFLGWKSGKGELMNLGQASENTRLFVTAPMNGCALIVGGPGDGPTVMHANYDSDTLRSSVKHADQLAVYTEAYKKISDQAVAGGHIPPENKVVFDPSKYLKEGSGVSAISVFGIKGEDGNWTLHYNARRQTNETIEPGWFGKLLGQKPQIRTRTELVTGEIWPNPDFSALEPR
ncbi:hypothetical protein [Hyalangium gracile]|uniref:hypothetical protein n=1 Tax=Hyalangium gracile TaxID=394092 RepID=UPI001CCF1152|nr:hypothetical protein [Hyalangium gracile]